MSALQILQDDIVLFANDLPEYHALPEGKAVTKAFYASAWADYDMPESYYMARELGALPSDEQATLARALSAYWIARNI